MIGRRARNCVQKGRAQARLERARRAHAVAVSASIDAGSAYLAGRITHAAYIRVRVGAEQASAALARHGARLEAWHRRAV